MLKSGTADLINNNEMAERFPDVDYDFQPFGNRVFVQIRYPKLQSASGLILASDTVEDSYRNEQVAVVRALGESCFKFMTTGEPWPSGEAFKVGDFVRVPLHGGDNHWEIFTNEKGEQQTILFKVFKDHEIIGRHRKPLDVKTNLAYI